MAKVMIRIVRVKHYAPLPRSSRLGEGIHCEGDDKQGVEQFVHFITRSVISTECLAYLRGAFCVTQDLQPMQHINAVFQVLGLKGLNSAPGRLCEFSKSPYRPKRK